ncbi:glycosyl transferase [Protomyces lactucae-debilis]|uniref:Alpha-1,3-glucosyltransferase n=1 Tax=Protomyces lactucae-debilis TaxID=2754530 RepID=A0A1Y2FD85_PROLT|nr:glycosyl transferase [Protomyces lactucae-debilis]ORY81881.1 glycosyl transferase [Protomyces lactucae-debilis]
MKQLEKHKTPLERIVAPLATQSNAHLVVPAILVVAYMARLAVSFGSYSGQGVSPMHGDFEAQRHWLELTQHLPMREWYFYDLQYWGLDYPPLTAFHSYALGKIGSLLNEDWFTLDTSRGIETYGVKLFMRHSVIASELLTYIPAVLLFSSLNKDTVLHRTVTTLTVLLQPAVLLIDHGHFQYNTVMLGLMTASLYFMMQGKVNLAAGAYVACLAFKQMGLYYAPVVFAYLLSVTYQQPHRFVLLGMTTVAAFALFFGPFLLVGGVSGLQQVIIRMFPFGRGLFEDKVANLWCAINVVYKLKAHIKGETLQRMSLLFTLLGVLPASIKVFLKPQPKVLLLATSSCAWAFFLFSFQVHEKSVLLPLLPTTLLLYSSHLYKSWIGYINIVAIFSLWPLLNKDGLGLQYAVLSLLWIWLCGFGQSTESMPIRAFHYATYLAMVACHALEPFFAVSHLPDLWTVANALVSFGAFAAFYLWTLYQLLLS